MSITEQLKQGTFESDHAPNCDVYHQFALCVTQCMKRMPLSRHGIAHRMTEALASYDVGIDVNKLNKWFAASQPLHMPVQYLPALCWALKSEEPANVLLKPLLFSAVDQRAKMLQQHGQLQLEIEERNRLQTEITETLMGGLNHD